jgi:hypothetical protein
VGGLIVVSMKVLEDSPSSRPDFSPSGERKRDSR